MENGSVATILVVDDESSVRDSLAGFLDDYSFEVSSAESAEAALDIVAEKFHDVAIVDLRLPGMDGDAMILLAHEKYPSMRYIIYTGSKDYRLSEKLQEIGIKSEHVFYKPQADLTRIVEAVKTLINE